jgi:hypothetical protein
VRRVRHVNTLERVAMAYRKLVVCPDQMSSSINRSVGRVSPGINAIEALPRTDPILPCIGSNLCVGDKVKGSATRTLCATLRTAIPSLGAGTHGRFEDSSTQCL